MPMPLTKDCLSAQDQAVLETVFNPFQLGGNVPNLFGPDVSHELEDPPEEQTAEIIESIRLEVDGVKTTENGDLIRALELFRIAIEIAPQRPSLYNNRAQALRLQGNDNEAFADLETAIRLSSGVGRTSCQAFCQRGVLYRKRNNLDAARRDFEEAAKMGSKFAKTQLVEINPYAALCNQMLREAFQKLS